MKPTDLILVIDMQNVYLPDAPWGCVTFHRSCDRIAALLSAVLSDPEPPAALFTAFFSDPNAEGVWKTYNRVYRDVNSNPWMGEIVDGLKPFLASFPIYRKSVYSSMQIPDVRWLAERAGRIILTGVISECCVLFTCMEAIDMGCQVVYLRDACSGDDPTKEEAVLTVLSGLVPLHVTIMDTDEYLSERSNEDTALPKAAAPQQLSS